MNWLDIITSIEKYVADISQDWMITQENVKFNSEPGTPFIQMIHHQVGAEPLTIGKSGVMDTEGILELGLNYPAGGGSGAVYSRADMLAEFFKPGQSIAAGGGNIVIVTTTLGSKEPSSKADYWSTPLLVHYHAYHNY